MGELAAWDESGPILPRYDGRSILNLPASICAALGAPTTALAPALDATALPGAMLQGVAAVLMLVVDGLGCWQLEAAITSGDAPALAALAERARRGADDVYPFSPRRDPTAFVGNHGALDRREMLVPLLVLRL